VIALNVSLCGRSASSNVHFAIIVSEAAEGLSCFSYTVDLKSALGKKRRDGVHAPLQRLTKMQRVYVSRLISKHGEDYQVRIWVVLPFSFPIHNQTCHFTLQRKLTCIYPISPVKNWVCMLCHSMQRSSINIGIRWLSNDTDGVFM
jgi:hypothetical protein